MFLLRGYFSSFFVLVLCPFGCLLSFVVLFILTLSRTKPPPIFYDAAKCYSYKSSDFITYDLKLWMKPKVWFFTWFTLSCLLFLSETDGVGWNWRSAECHIPGSYPSLVRKGSVPVFLEFAMSVFNATGWLLGNTIMGISHCVIRWTWEGRQTAAALFWTTCWGCHQADFTPGFAQSTQASAALSLFFTWGSKHWAPLTTLCGIPDVSVKCLSRVWSAVDIFSH